MSLRIIVKIILNFCLWFTVATLPLAEAVKNFEVIRHVNATTGMDEFYLVFKHHFRRIEDCETVKTLGFNPTEVANWTFHHFVNKLLHHDASMPPITLIKDDRSNPDAIMATTLKKIQAVIPYPLIYNYTTICDGCKNPAVILWHDQFLCISEFGRIKHGVLQHFWINTTEFPVKNAVLFGITTEPSGNFNNMEPIFGVDPRTSINHQTNGVEIVYACVQRYPPVMARSELNVNNLTNEKQQLLANYTTRHELIILDQAPPKGQHEKNWIPFYYNNSRYLVQSINPLHVVSVHPTIDADGTTYLHTQTISKELANIEWDYGTLRGGTNAVRLVDQYLAIFHSVKDLGVRRKTYFFGAYAFSLHPPFRIIAISAVPIMDEFLYTGPWYTMLGSKSYTYVAYPTSLMIEKKGVLLMSIGMNDDKGYLCRMRIRDLLESMAPVHFS